ncbi:MAG: hypothetical protein AAGF06_02755 [Pseudomonadota bacterium]
MDMVWMVLGVIAVLVVGYYGIVFFFFVTKWLAALRGIRSVLGVVVRAFSKK